MKNFVLLFMCSIMYCSILYGQNQGIQIGTNLKEFQTSPQGGYYDYSDPQSVNIKVAIWGWVKFPGKYVIPSYSSINDLLSYSGGPTDAAHLENLKLLRTNKDSSQSIVEIKYKDLMMNPSLGNIDKSIPLLPGDVLLVTGEPRLYFRDFLSITVSVVSALVSLATLVVLIVKK